LDICRSYKIYRSWLACSFSIISLLIILEIKDSIQIYICVWHLVIFFILNWIFLSLNVFILVI
jgi:hypothetical protein